MNSRGESCGMPPLIGENYCVIHSTSEQAEQARAIALFKRTQHGRKYTLLRILSRAERNKKLSFSDKSAVMLRIFGLLDRIETREKLKRDREEKARDLEERSRTTRLF